MQAFRVLPLGTRVYRISGVTLVLPDIRRANLKEIVQAYGGTAAFARKLGVSDSQLAQWMHGSKDSKTKKPRGMRDETCRKIEAAAGKPTGWMDIAHPPPGRDPEPPAPSPLEEMFSARALLIARRFDNLPPEKRDKTGDMLEFLLDQALPPVEPPTPAPAPGQGTARARHRTGP